MIKSKILKTVIFILIITLFSTATVIAKPSSWAEDFIKSMLLEGLGSEELLDSSKFQQAITREEFAELTVLLYAKAKGINVNDIIEWDPFYDSNNIMVSKAYNIGIVSGTGEDRLERLLFSPKKTVTRQEIAVMLIKELKILGVDVEVKDELSFSDKDIIASWAYDAVSFATKNGILSGIGDNKVAPTSNATREQALVLINKIAIKYGWIDNSELNSFFNTSNATINKGFYIPNDTELRIISKSNSIKYIVSNLVDTYKPDIFKQQREVINIYVNSDVSYDAFVNVRERILNSYDFVSKKFRKTNTVYINPASGVESSLEIQRPFILIKVDTNISIEYVY